MESDHAVLMTRFIDHLTVERDLSPNTVDAYRRDLEKFRLFLDDRDLEAADVKRVDVEAFIGSLRTAGGLSARSTVRALSALRTFYRFLRTEGYCEVDPAARVERPVLWKKLPVVLDFFEIEDLLAAPDMTTRNSSGSTARAGRTDWCPWAPWRSTISGDTGARPAADC